MDLPKARRYLNDSRIGKIINHSVLGILFESGTRGLVDVSNKVKLELMSLRAYLIGRKDPELGIYACVDLLVEGMETDDIFNIHSYSSPLYEIYPNGDGLFHVKRRSLREALAFRKKEDETYSEAQIKLPEEKLKSSS
ncbi:hypothetical protein ACFLZN_00450 [Nanoarchaeota archaeon]